MQIAIVGAGPAGALASILLAKNGHNVTLVDSQAPWEKPCGGGVTAKALTRFTFLGDELPKKQIERITIYFGDSHSVSVTPQHPLAVVSRRELGRRLLDQAVGAGAHFVQDRVTNIENRDKRWLLRTRESEISADYLVGADGATGIVRRTVGQAFAPEDLCVTMGYFIPGDPPPHMKIFFVPEMDGYIWSFPRPGHVSYGLITRSAPAWTVRARELLGNFIEADLGSDVMAQAEFYSAPVPCLSPRAWKKNAVAGDRWSLLGDAAGLADPITGEGIHFALRSAELLAENIDRPGQYAAAVSSNIGHELARAARMYKTFYRGRFLGGDFRKRTIQLSCRSRTLSGILGNLITGNQPYLSLKKRLFLSIPRIGWDFVTGKR